MKSRSILFSLIALACTTLGWSQPVIVTVSSQAEMTSVGVKGLIVALIGDPALGPLGGMVAVESDYGPVDGIVLCVYDENRKLLVRSVLGVQILEPALHAYEFTLDHSLISNSEILVSKRNGDEVSVLKIKLAGFIRNKK